MQKTLSEYEEAVVAAMFLEPAHAVNIAMTMLKAEDFAGAKYRILFTILSQMYDAGTPIDMLSLYHEVEKRGQLEEIGGAMALANLGDYVATASNVTQHAAIVKDNAVRRRIALQVKNASAMIDMETESIPDILDGLEVAIDTAQERIQPTQSFGEILDAAVMALQIRCEQGISGLKTGFPSIDDKTGGFMGSELIILAGRPSTGKTSLALDFARRMQQTHSAVGIISLEMTTQEIVYRILSSELRINSTRIRKADLENGQWEKVSMGMAKIKSMRLFIEHRGVSDIFHIIALSRKWKQDHNIKCLIIDYLQLIESPGSESRQLEVADISRRLKGLAKVLEIPVIVLSQLNRGTEGRAEGKPKLSDLRDSGAIEQDADIVMMLYHPGNYNGNDDKAKTQLIVSKNRNGETGEVDLIFEKEYATFREPQIWERERN